MFVPTGLNLLTILTWLGLIPIGLLIWVAWNYRHQPAFRWFIIAMGGLGLWTLSRGAALFTNSPSLTIFFDRVIIFCISLVAICWFLMAVESVFRQPVSQYVFAGLLSVPLATQFIGLARPTLLYTADSYVDDRGVFYNNLGPWLAFDLHIFGYGLILAAIALWTGSLLTGQRKQVELSATLLTGTLLMAIPPVLHTTGFVPDYVDATPLALFVTGGVFFYALRGNANHRLELGPGREHAFDIIDEAILITNRHGMVIDMNTHLGDIIEADRLIGQNVADIFPDTQGLTEAFRSGTSDWSGTVSPADMERYFEAELSTVEYGTGAMARVLVLKDITELKQREQQLTRQNERLEKFTGTISHDIRNPLSVAKGRATLLADETDSEHLPPIVDALDRIDTLISETLTLAKQGQTVAETETVRLDTVSHRCWDRVETGGASLTVVDDGEFRADVSRVEQIFENLFRNAIEHCGEDVAVTVGRTGDGFYVSDDGPGIPESERADVLKFGHTSTTDGTGYGLHIVAEIAEAHQWRIDISASRSGGARFTFSGVTFTTTSSQN
ncbi:histidine kinase N-terminal 7TM domain-containing protein [Haloarcula laminariae]|uniref:histidine kinase N-terminal 7TM domain-containing protein n=1 Tax=Haloarcula laminariae TaxID=2961577 RepID=UPI0021CA36FE|nr:histidine kinase N-terminal 7TM domain-containing protein [Halomicroarcula laminariae]